MQINTVFTFINFYVQHAPFQEISNVSFVLKNPAMSVDGCASFAMRKLSVIVGAVFG